MTVARAYSDLAQLRAAGALSALDVQLARALQRLSGERDERVLIAAALASRQAQAGHVCVDLAAWIAAPTFELAADATAPRWPALGEWIAALEASALVGDENAERPLFLDPRGRLYLRRLYRQERSVAEGLLARAKPVPLEVDEGLLQHGLERLFPDAAEKAPAPSRAKKTSAQMSLLLEADEAAAPAASTPGNAQQRVAAERGARARLTVITGGPGTGKTHTVANLLALLIEQGLKIKHEAPRILLLAPTGKAAQRLTESMAKAKGVLRVDDEVRAAIEWLSASTLHRALGVRRDVDRRGRSDEPEQLTAEVVIVDEASMVDLALMARLLQAVPADARLVLLGDKDQLASVEAGAVLGDICDPARAAVHRDEPLAGCIVELTHTHRFKDDSGIGKLAAAIRSGDAQGALELLRDPRFEDVQLREHLPPPSPREPQPIHPDLVQDAARAFGELIATRDVAARLQMLDRFRVLCAHRNGPFGVGTLNARIEQALRDAGRLDARSSGQFDGRPILVTENDYDSKLFNGDVGVLCEGEDESLRAFFPRPGVDRAENPGLALARLPAHESVFAMSVHKSQGSEADRVAIVLPDETSPLLSRELLYTAVTRARERVVVYGSAAAIAACVRQPMQRSSGLRDALWGSV